MPVFEQNSSKYVVTSKITHSPNVLACYTDQVTGGYTAYWTSLQKVYNDTIRRVKPDPLTDTALPLQSTRRIRPSEVELQVDRSVSAYCNGIYGTRYYWLGGHNVAYESQTDAYPLPDTDWGNKAIRAAAQNFVNLGSSLAEYRETGRMFAKFGQGMAKAWRAYKGTKRLNLNLTPCSVPAAELAYSFGVRPLAEDLFSAAEVLRIRLGLPLVFRHTAQSRATAAYDTRSTPHELSTHSLSNEKYSVSDRVKMQIGLQTLGDSEIVFGNPVNWAWELIPFSFVVDWGIPIGQWLEDLDTLKNIAFVKGTRTRKVQKVRYYKMRVKRWNGSYFYGSLGKTSFKSHQRFLVTSLPTPPVPRWSPSETYHKVYRAVTLLIAVNQPCRKYSGRKRSRSSRN